MSVTTVIESDIEDIVVNVDQTFVSAPIIKEVAFTRDMTTASGAQSITGVGFSPRLVLFRSVLDTFGASFGSSGNNCLYFFVGDNVWRVLAVAGIIVRSSGNYQQFSVTSFDADGFTVSWAKVGTPTGTGLVYADCFR